MSLSLHRYSFFAEPSERYAICRHCRLYDIGAGGQAWDNRIMKDELFKRITDFYRASRDFNGLYFKSDNEEERETAIALVRDELVQVVESEVDYPNPHIRPWPPRRSIDEQVESIR